MTCNCTSKYKCELIKWINDALKNENLKQITVEISGTSGKGDGLMGDITFINVFAVDSKENNKEYNLVLKHGNKIEALRKNLPIHEAYEREIFLYSKVFPAIHTFQKENNLEPMDFIPKCFSTMLNDSDQFIILENLKMLGYDLHDKHAPMDQNHIILTMKAYGQYHALSFALRDQRNQEYNKLFANLKPILQNFLCSDQMGPALEYSGIQVCNILKERGEHALLEKYKNKMRKGALKMFRDILNMEEKDLVLTHGDCWNNNYMFKYEDINSTRAPTKVALLDFQVAQLGSPVFDLSYHLYSVCSENDLQSFEELIKIYYSTFSVYMRKLGSDPDKVFPYSLLVEHWKKYSGFGLIISCFSLPVATLQKEDVIDLENFDEDGFRGALKTFTGKSRDELYSRIVAIVKHFLEFKF